MADAKKSPSSPTRRTVVLTFNLNPVGGGGDENGVDRPLQLPFAPREVTLRQITWSGTATPGTITVISTDLLPGRTMCTFSGAADGSVAPCTAFSLKEVSASPNFNFIKAGAGVKTTYVGFVSLTLDFCA